MLPEPDLRRVRAEEVEGGAAGLDVHPLPPGRPGAPRVQLRRGVEPSEIEVDDDDTVQSPRRERPRDSRPDDATADDEGPHACHASRLADAGVLTNPACSICR